jgi:hypothetical protein
MRRVELTIAAALAALALAAPASACTYVHTTFNVPGSAGAFVQSVNATGAVTGCGYNGSSRQGFIAAPTVPGPATWEITLVGLGGIGAAMRISRRSRQVTVAT